MSESIQSTAQAYFIDGYLQEIPEHRRECCESVATIILDWLDCSDGVYACHADFQTFLMIVIAIQEYWNKHPESTSGFRYKKYTGEGASYVLKPLTSFLGDDGLGHPIFDRHRFESTVFERLHGDRLRAEQRR